MSQPLCAIVGSGEGLGRSLAAKFAGEGLDIALISRSEKGSRAATQETDIGLLQTASRPVGVAFWGCQRSADDLQVVSDDL